MIQKLIVENYRKIFPKKLLFKGIEKINFMHDYFYKSILMVRLALILGIILYSAFGILDHLISPLSKFTMYIIRFAIVVPSLIITLIITFTGFFEKHMQLILSIISSIAGLGIIIMIAASKDVGSSLYYYAGLMLVIMWTYTFVKLLFKYAAIICWSLVIAYEIVAIYFQNLLSNPESIKIFINNNFFFISANIIGMFACYLIEFYTRKDYSRRLELAESKKELQVERNNLKDRIKIMNSELEMAKTIQQKLIPTTNPNENIFSLYKPMEAVGGDLIDFIDFKKSDNIGLFLSDVSGHGVPAALITSMIKSSIFESKKIAKNPALLLSHLNELLYHQTDDYFVTAFYGIFNKHDRSIIYSNAGHHPPSVILSKKIVTLDRAKSIPLAVMGNFDLIDSGIGYTNSKAILPSNSKLVIYTDGLVEARNLDTSPIEYGDVINNYFREYYSLKCKEFVNTLYGNLEEFHGGSKFSDDICIVCMDID